MDKMFKALSKVAKTIKRVSESLAISELVAKLRENGYPEFIVKQINDNGLKIKELDLSEIADEPKYYDDLLVCDLGLLKSLPNLEFVVLPSHERDERDGRVENDEEDLVSKRDFLKRSLEKALGERIEIVNELGGSF